MSTCPDKDLYSVYIDGELSSPWKEKLESHLKNCSKCKAILDSYIKIKNRLRNTEIPELDIEKSFLKLCKKRKHKSPKAPTSWFYKSVKVPLPALVAAALFLFVFTPIIIFNTRQPSQSAEGLIVSNFKPIMPVSTAIQKKKKTFTLTDPYIFNITKIKTVPNKEKNEITLNQFLNLYLPSEMTKTEEGYKIMKMLQNSSFFKHNSPEFSVNFVKNEQ